MATPLQPRPVEDLDLFGSVQTTLDIIRDLVPEDSRYKPERLAHVLALVERFRKEITAGLIPPRAKEAQKPSFRLVIDNTRR